MYERNPTGLAPEITRMLCCLLVGEAKLLLREIMIDLNRLFCISLYCIFLASFSFHFTPFVINFFLAHFFIWQGLHVG
jgi:hypothetical protein